MMDVYQYKNKYLEYVHADDPEWCKIDDIFFILLKLSLVSGKKGFQLPAPS